MRAGPGKGRAPGSQIWTRQSFLPFTTSSPPLGHLRFIPHNSVFKPLFAPNYFQHRLPAAFPGLYPLAAQACRANPGAETRCGHSAGVSA